MVVTSRPRTRYVTSRVGGDEYKYIKCYTTKFYTCETVGGCTDVAWVGRWVSEWWWEVLRRRVIGDR